MCKRFLVWVFLGIFFFLGGQAWASFLKAQGLWPVPGLRRVVVYKDAKKGTKLAFVAGEGGIYTLDVTDPFHPKKLSLTSDELPFPGQVQDMKLIINGKKPSLLVADGSGGFCSFSLSSRGLSKPKCQDTGGFAYALWPVNKFLLTSQDQKLSFWDLSGKEWSLICEVDLKGEPRALYFFLPSPDLLEPVFDNMPEGVETKQVEVTVGRVYVALNWEGIGIFKLVKVMTYDVPQEEGQESTLLKISYVLEPDSSWQKAPVYDLVGHGTILAVATKNEVKVFQLAGQLNEIYTYSSAVDPSFLSPESLFLVPFSEKRFFLFVPAGRQGLKVLEINQEGPLSVTKVAESLEGIFAKGVFLDEDLFFYEADTQAGLLIGRFFDYVRPSLSIPADCRGLATARLGLSFLGPLKGNGAFFCVWLEIPVCQGAKGLAGCKALGFKEEELSWEEVSYVLTSPAEKIFEWRPGRPCYPVEKLEEIKDLPILREEHGFSCAELDGAKLYFCLDLDRDLYPDFCTQATFQSTSEK